MRKNRSEIKRHTEDTETDRDRGDIHKHEEGKQMVCELDKREREFGWADRGADRK